MVPRPESQNKVKALYIKDFFNKHLKSTVKNTVKLDRVTLLQY
jgi:hypothetical protein